MPSPVSNVADVLEKGAAYLAARRVPDARIAVELLMSRLLRCGRLDLHLRREVVLSGNLLDAMRRGTLRVAAGEPVQYVLGEVDFRGHLFKVDRRALIPRPETEELVECVLGCEALWAVEGGKPVIMDVGTGSGCMILSLAIERPGSFYAGLDVSGDALALAQENAQAKGLASVVPFLHGELADVVDPGKLDAVISNPPYIATSVYEQLPGMIRDHEPRLALDGGPDGLGIIESIIGDAAIALKPGGHLFLEIGHDQGGRVGAMLDDAGYTDVQVRRDMAGHDRIVHAVIE